MTLIDRYVLSTFTRVLLWALLAFLAVFVLIDLVDHIDDFIDDEARLISVLKYYLYVIPQYIDFVLPISIMLASLFTVALLSKNQEFTAILASGTSLLRMSRTVLVFGVVLTIFGAVWREEVVARANRLHTEVLEYEIEGRERDRLQGRSNFTYVDRAGRVYVVSRFRPRPPTLENLSIQTFTDSTLVERIDVRRARWQEDHWELQQGTIRSFEGGTESMETISDRRLEDPVVPPAYFAKPKIDPDEMNWRQLRDFASRVESTGGDPTPYRAEMATKLSFPLVNILVVVLGLALGAAHRKPTLWSGFGITIGLAFGYYVLSDLGLELGKSGTIPPLISAWSGNVLYAIAGAALFWRANR